MMKMIVPLLFISLTAGPALAAADCKVIERFALEGALPILSKRAPNCSTSRVLGGDISQDCFYAYAFRSPEARANFETLASHLQSCAEAAATPVGARVNHPDSYDQLTASVKGRSVSISLKDKGALEQTLIVLRRVLP